MKRLKAWWKAWRKKQAEKPFCPLLGFGRDCFPPVSDEVAERLSALVEEHKRKLEQEIQREEP